MDLSPLAAAAHAAGALLIDDAAQGVGSSVAGRPVGGGGDYGILSFGRGKGRTGGAGGAVFASSPPAERRLRDIAARLAPSRTELPGYLALLGQYWLGRPSLYWIPASLPWLRLGQTIYRPPPELRRMAQRSAAVLEAVWDLSLAE